MFKQNVSFDVWGGDSGKYRLRDENKKPIENSPEETCERVARALSDVELENKDHYFNEFKKIIGTKFAGGGRIMANAGTKSFKREVSLINCFVKGTLVTTSNGPKPIEEIAIGELVVTHNNRFMPVIQTHKNPLLGRQVFSLKCFRTPEINVTENHKFYSISDEQANWGIIKPQWNEAKYLRTGDWIAIPSMESGTKDYEIDIYNEIFTKVNLQINNDFWYTMSYNDDTLQLTSNWNYKSKKTGNVSVRSKQHRKINRKLKINEEFAFFLGLWYGDGCIFSRDKDSDKLQGITFTFNSKETDLIKFVSEYGEKIFGISPTIVDNTRVDSTTQIRFDSTIIAHIFESLFGRGFDKKRLHSSIYSWDISLVHKLLAGLISSDGTITGCGDIRVVMANRKLIKEFYHLSRLNGIIVGYSELKPQKNPNFAPKALTARLDFPKELDFITSVQKVYSDSRLEKSINRSNTPTQHVKTIDGIKFVQITKKEKIKTDDQYVYTLGVKDDHSYVVEGIVCENCVVSRQIPDSMFGIMEAAKEAALILRSGCGIGYDFSTLRPKGAHVFGAGAGTSGVISFMKIFDVVCSTIMSAGTRRGAQLGALDIQHPDIEEFITAKRQDGVLRYFNLSCLITDNFMRAVENNSDWNLWFWEKRNVNINSDKIKIIKKNDIPFNHPEYEYFSFAEDHVECVYNKTSSKDVFVKKMFKTVKANYLFDLIMKSTYNFAEPGFILIDHVNKENNLWFIETIRASNPCVTGDTRLHTNHGMVTVKDLYDSQVNIKCTVDNRSFSKDFGISVYDAIPVFKTSDSAKIFKITTDAGYEIKATEWHKFFTPRGKLELKDLKIGDPIYIQSDEGQWGNKGSYEIGFIYGMLVGDGHFKKENDEYYANISLWGSDKELSNELEIYINNIISNSPHNGNKNRIYNAKFCTIESRNEARLTSCLLARHLIELGANPSNKYEIPEFIWQGKKECVVGFLKGLFQSDGTVCISGKKNKRNKYTSCDIRLNSSERKLLVDVQRLLSNFGIFSKIHLRRKELQKQMPDGKGGSKLYKCKDNYELIIGSVSRNIFMEKIGFALDYKNNKYNIFKSGSIKKSSQSFETKISNIEYVGTEAVYDTTQNTNHSLIFNGIATGNCGEQMLSPLSNCLLGSMILCPYVKNQFTSDASFDFESYASDVKIAARALDNVVEIANLPLKELTESLNYQRRHGMGFTGLGSALNMLGLKYGSKESLDFAEKISLIMAQQNLIAAIDISKEKGCAPFCKTEEARILFMDSGYMKRLLSSFGNEENHIRDEIKKFGVRWSHATSIAPTGTLSLTWGNNCSNGLEPIFANSYLRNFRSPGKKTKTQQEVYDYAYFEWKSKCDGPLPSYWSTTENLTVEDHINMQAVIQKWIDSATSKTVNIPTSYPFEDFKKVYINGWKLNLKGVTTFRFNPEAFSGVLVQKNDLMKTSYTFILEDNTEIIVNGNDEIEYDGEMHNAANLFDALKENIYGDM